ncbi:hypothetical protein RSSM_05532 [Rhodopirellula sallentina SM41]|uniref:Uncharacterized protein n=1 Tax=Rhodopirellula sallentina SM41 TaxID=1263870 RepID=M5TVF5_9BACT|nr:hypothetical protein RSSM_05532 [Rhodopirellula sallentina SM41]
MPAANLAPAASVPSLAHAYYFESNMRVPLFSKNASSREARRRQQQRGDTFR